MANIFDLFDKISKKNEPVGNIEYIIAGLGNPGAEYERTRHNAGFMCIDSIADRLGARINTAKFSALICDTQIGGKRALLMKPQTFMNLSGNAVAEAARFYKIAPENIIVLVDDINFEPSFMRIRRRGSHGGHNGIKDIIAKLGADTFPRIKLGVGKKPAEHDMIDFVLGKLCKSDLDALVSCFDSCYNAVCDIIAGDIDGAMNRYSK